MSYRPFSTCEQLWPILMWVSLALVSTRLPAQVSPSADQNYVIEQTPRTGQQTISLSSGYSSVPATVSYLDGLGRPVQTVQVKGAGDAGADIVTEATTYDAYGRPDQTFLPLPGGVGGVRQTNLQLSGQSFYSDQNPYSQTLYEASPLNRPRQQWGPGQNWRSADRSQQIRYGVAGNGTTSFVIRFKVNFSSNAIYGNVEGNGSLWDYYEPGDVATHTFTDEQTNQTVEYTDLQGRVIRRDVLVNGQTQTTVYVFDTYERLAAIIPPKLYDWFVNGGSSQTLFFYIGGDANVPNPQFKDNCFAYQYDARGRLIRKQIPSAGWTDLVYDFQDRLVMSQDQQDKASAQWRYTRYDGLNRVIETGRLPLNRSADNLRSDFAVLANETFPGTVSPASVDHLTESHYDNYTGSPLTFNTNGAFSAPWGNAIGMLTYSGTRNLQTGAWYSSALWYDDKKRIVQQQSQNHLGGTDRTDVNYQFNGEVLQTVLRHQKISGGSITTAITSYTYDHLSRRTSLTYQLGTDSPRTIAVYGYDGIGRLAQKGLEAPNSNPITNITRFSSPTGNPTLDIATQYVQITPENFNVNNAGNASGLYEARIGFSALQSLDYRYHIRGWLRGVNVDGSGQPLLNASRNDVFAFGLDYETAGYYDGNIGRQRWLGSRQPTQTRQYSYSYDAASRLTAATYSGAAGETYSLSDVSYDKNGNIQTLNRAGIDQLSYTYSQGNQLLTVADGSGNTAGFSDGNTSGSDYAYLPEGSVSKDLNRGIIDIQYNLLKLPRQVTFNSGKTINYQYDATGRKLQMSTSTGEVRDYTGPFQYLNGNLFEVGHEEGRIVAGSPNVYEYFHRDHLGNIRAVVANNGSGGVSVSQWVDYDPWGLELSSLSSGSSTNRLRFNGKESLAEVGGGLMDFGARGYDATIGRMHQVDAAAELFADVSGFNFGLNNPVMNIDPTGDTTIPYQQVNWHSFNTNNNEIGLNEVSVTIKGNSNVGGSSEGILYTESGQRVNRDGSPYWDANDMRNTQLFLPYKQAGSEWVDLADNILAMFSPFKALTGLTLLAKVNPAGKAVAVTQIAAKVGETAATKLGKAMHKVYRSNDVVPGIKIKEFTLPSGKRVDFIDFQNKIIYELKPNNKRAIKAGEKQLKQYLSEVESVYGPGFSTILDKY